MGPEIVWGDEMRVGLIGRVWVPRRVEVRQAVPFSRKYMYLAVAIDPLTGSAVVGVAGEHEGRGDGPNLAGLGGGDGHQRLGLG